MKAFLLTAGLGTRLRPLTDEMPKCLLPLGGKPLLKIWLELLSRYYVDQVLINTHWHAEKVERFVGEQVNSYSLIVNSERNAGIKDTEVGGRRSEVRGRKDRDQRSEVRVDR